MASNWFCLKCYKNMGDKEYCSYCGAHRLGDNAMSKKEAESVVKKFFERKAKKKKQSQPIFFRRRMILTWHTS